MNQHNHNPEPMLLHSALHKAELEAEKYRILCARYLAALEEIEMSGLCEEDRKIARRAIKGNA